MKLKSVHRTSARRAGNFFTAAFILYFYFVSPQKVSAQNVNIPDANFKAWVLYNIQHVDPNEITISEAAAYYGLMSIHNLGISDLTGIEAFTNLSSLDCHGNQLTTLNLSANTALTELQCFGNNLTSLDLSSNTALTYLDCNQDHLTSLNINSDTSLTYLNCSMNQLPDLNLNSNINLTYLECSDNPLTHLDVSSNTALEHLACIRDQLSSLEVTTNTALTWFYCGGNYLTTLDLSHNTALTNLYCWVNQLSTLDLSSNTALTVLRCDSNLLTSLDLSSNIALTGMICNSNHLTGLDVSADTNLTLFECGSNPLLTWLNMQNGHNASINIFWAVSTPDLTCIQVDDSAYSAAHWTNIDADEYFSTNCLTALSINEIKTPANVTIYPNPITDNFVISNNEYKSVRADVYNMFGEIVQSQNVISGRTVIDMNSKVKGIYFVKVIDADKNLLDKKIILQ